MSLVLYHFEMCPYCAKVRNVISELGIDVVMKDTRKNDAYRDELTALNGSTQVPCLVVDGKPMLESDVIVEYLGKHYG